MLLVVEEVPNRPPLAGLLPKRPPVEELVFPNKPPLPVVVEVDVLPKRPPEIAP